MVSVIVPITRGYLTKAFPLQRMLTSLKRTGIEL